MNLETDVRRLRHRLKRLGMLELDVWLSGLDVALCEQRDKDVIFAINQLLMRESPELLAMMEGRLATPAILRPWLKRT